MKKLAALALGGAAAVALTGCGSLTGRQADCPYFSCSGRDTPGASGASGL